LIPILATGETGRQGYLPTSLTPTQEATARDHHSLFLSAANLLERPARKPSIHWRFEMDESFNVIDVGECTLSRRERAGRSSCEERLARL
jgi:hypothetical protein